MPKLIDVFSIFYNQQENEARTGNWSWLPQSLYVFFTQAYGFIDVAKGDGLNPHSVPQNLEGVRSQVHMSKSLDEQFQLHKEPINEMDRFKFREALKHVNVLLSSGEPDSISVQLTDDESLFFTCIKNDLTIYFEYFVNHENEGQDELLLSVMKGSETLLSFAGSLFDGCVRLNQQFKFPVGLPQFA